MRSEFENNLEQRSDELDRKLDNNPIDAQIEALTKADKRQSRRVKLLALTIFFDVLLTIGFGYITFKTHQMAVKADSNADALVRSCETANDARRNQKALWDFVLKLTPQTDQSPEQQDRTKQFKAFVDKTFVERNCQQEINTRNK